MTVVQQQTRRRSTEVHVSATQQPVSDRWTRATELFVAWREGNSRALDDLVRLLTPVLWQVARAAGLDQQQAEDVVQSSWLTLVRKADGIGEPAALGAWLMTTTRRAAWRSAQAERRYAPVDDEVLGRRAGTAPGADGELESAEEAALLWNSVRRLDARCQRLLRVIAFDDRPDYTKISADLGMPVGSIGPTRGRCLAKLRGLLETTKGERA
jgi:RNA polymerase sigma factor (sigma-70 family)